jgi:hypothetical protein
VCDIASTSAADFDLAKKLIGFFKYYDIQIWSHASKIDSTEYACCAATNDCYTFYHVANIVILFGKQKSLTNELI